MLMIKKEHRAAASSEKKLPAMAIIAVMGMLRERQIWKIRKEEKIRTDCSSICVDAGKVAFLRPR